MFHQEANQATTTPTSDEYNHSDPNLCEGKPGTQSVVRWAEGKDRLSIIRSLQSKKIEYMTIDDMMLDVYDGRLAVYEKDGKILGWLAVHEPFGPRHMYDYVSLKRGFVPNKKNRKKGVMNALIQWVLQQYPTERISATPWEDNIAMRKILEKNDFKLAYKFGLDDKWCLYLSKRRN